MKELTICLATLISVTAVFVGLHVLVFWGLMNC